MILPNSVIVLISSALAAQANCARLQDGKPVNPEWLDIWTERLRYLERNCLPSGSGIDSGTSINFDRSTPDRIVLETAFHHMDENGMYDGWTEHTVTVRPSFVHGVSLQISGRNRNEIKDYLADVFSCALQETAEYPEVKKIA